MVTQRLFSKAQHQTVPLSWIRIIIYRKLFLFKVYIVAVSICTDINKAKRQYRLAYVRLFEDN